MAADPVLNYLSKDQLEKNISLLKKSMESEARQENFIEAARLRDQMYNMMEQLARNDRPGLEKWLAKKKSEVLKLLLWKQVAKLLNPEVVE